MNQANPMNAPTQPINNPAPTTQPQKTGNMKLIKGIIITVVSITVVVLGAFIYNDQMGKKRVSDRATADETITQLIYNIRDDARVFYEKNQSYKEWWPKSETLIQVSKLGSTVIYRKPDFQSFVIYAYSQTDQKNFCVDSKGFADFVSLVNDTQIKCQ